MNLTEIRNKEYAKWKEGNGYDYTIACMREAARKALEMAAERAKARVFMPTHPALHDTENAIVDKQSILDVMEEIDV